MNCSIKLLEIIDQQSMNGSLILTNQYPSEYWYDLFEDLTIADAILDRIVHKHNLIVDKGFWWSLINNNIH